MPEDGAMTSLPDGVLPDSIGTDVHTLLLLIF